MPGYVYRVGQSVVVGYSGAGEGERKAEGSESYELRFIYLYIYIFLQRPMTHGAFKKAICNVAKTTWRPKYAPEG